MVTRLRVRLRNGDDGNDNGGWQDCPGLHFDRREVLEVEAEIAFSGD